MIALAITGASAAAAGCQVDIDKIDGVFYNGDNRTVHCAVDIDDADDVSHASIDSGLDRAVDRNEVVELFAHHPNVTVSDATLEYVMAGAQSRGLPFVTYADFAHGTAPAAGLALSLDDNSIEDWTATRALFTQYSARITFFVSRYSLLTDDEHAQIHQLADDGHDIEAHTVHHLRAPAYVEDHGLQSYLDDEVVPSIEVLRAEGYEVPVFAYPFGSRTDELDNAILEHVTLLRSLSYTFEDGPTSPCPR